MATGKPVIKSTDVWAWDAPEEDLLVPYEKIDEGWGYANKPSFQYLNWFWNTQSAFYNHINTYGVPEYDSETVYKSSGFALHEGTLYQAFSDTQRTVPGVDSRVWRSMDYLNGLHDVNIDMPAYRDILVFNNGVWENLTPRKAMDMELGEVQDVTDDGTIDTVLAYDGAGWKNYDINTLISDKLSISDFEDTRIDNAVDGEILQFRPYKVFIEEDDAYEDQWRWQNTYYQGYVNYNNITGAPTEHKCVPASYKDVGGARMWKDETGTFPVLHVDTNRVGYVPKPYGLEATIDEVGMVKLTWNGTLVADEYKVYMDGVLEGSTPTTSYNINTNDNEWHVFYVKTQDTIEGIIYLSDPSNFIMGKQR